MKYYLRRMKQGLSLAAWISLSIACSNPGKSAGGETPKAPDQPKQSEDARPVISNPPDASAARIVLSLKGLAGLKNLAGYIVDGVDQHGFKAIENDRYAFFSMKPGRYDFIIEGQRANDDASQPNMTGVGIRISGVNVKVGEDTIIREAIELRPTFAIKGKVRLLNGVTHGAINVQVPGTRIKSKTEGDGSFTLLNVPLGAHSIVASNVGYLDALYEGRQWSGQDAPELQPLTLLPSDQALPTGVHYKGDGMTAGVENSVTVFLVRPAGMNKFRISETSDFAAAVWQDFQSTFDVKFRPAGERKLFVQYSKDQQQFSAIFSTEIPMAQP